MNPATFLRVLGPEPWRVAYVEPSVRPDDARYGENPNRMGLFYQYQVILKPDPGDPQELYLRSLEKLGIDLRQHDMRFVEDNWQQPALGAWGLGWEVWMDGLEITQFTYFQQAGGQRLDPVSVELTYGLERILMAMQGVEHFADVRWNPTHTYGDLNLAAEREHSAYYFEAADINRLLRMYQDYLAEAQRALEAGLLMPAYDYLLKCSHTFNVLDTRGAIGVTERASYFGEMRRLAGRVAEVYLQQREQAGHPWTAMTAGVQLPTGARAESGENSESTTAGLQEVTGSRQTAVEQAPGPPAEAADFILEIGTEELPPGDLSAALDQLEAGAPAMLEALRLDHASVRVMGTPRRLVLHVERLAAAQADREVRQKGPPWSKAFDGDDGPTAAGRGFAASVGLTPEQLEREELDGGEYAIAVVREAGKAAAEVLPAELTELLDGIGFEKSMRWNGGGTSFSRPIRWILALHGEHPVAFEYAQLPGRPETHGLRGQGSGSLTVKSSAGYFEALAGQGIEIDPAQRRSTIAEQVKGLAAEVGGQVLEDAELLEEVTNLVEAPVGLRGAFSDEYLELPRQVLVMVLKKHQRCFPVEVDGDLSPHFIAVSNAVGGELATHGHEQVVRARFADAAYFVARDLERPLEGYLPRLETLTFQSELGSMADKARRIQRLAERLAEQFELSTEQRAAVVRAAQLCKADLATQMVVDMTALQGSMGRYYAVQSGESEAVGQAIYEHYLPRAAGDELPGSQPGLVLAIADRLDSLAGLFAVGVEPTGTRDPYALRRSAIGLVQLLVEKQRRLDLGAALRMALETYAEQQASEAEGRSLAGLENEEAQVVDRCLDFIVRRLEGLLLDQGWPHDVVQAVLAEQGHDPARAAEAVGQLADWVGRDDWMQLLNAYARSARITRDLPQQYDFVEAALTEEASRKLYQAVSVANGSGRPADSVDEFMERFLPLVPVIDEFFDNVLVMAEDKQLRENRLALLQQVVRLADGVADLSKLEGF